MVQGKEKTPLRRVAPFAVCFAKCLASSLFHWCPDGIFINIHNSGFFIPARNAVSCQIDVKNKACSRIKMDFRRLHVRPVQSLFAPGTRFLAGGRWQVIAHSFFSLVFLSKCSPFSYQMSSFQWFEYCRPRLMR